ncbi:MAG: caspase family protein [Rhodocyclaceae bacterium]|nr:caspase family protein [Rhodocyclaceae bacterium]MDZ4215484.1 caspase family protein [Rhodocyclaceae bacterium]
MTTRRQFVKAMAALPPALALSQSLAATPEASRLALVIGNANYRTTPLRNPVNDAQAMGKLLEQAGFRIQSHLNAGRDEMIGAIRRFGAAANRPETRLAVFYYAGHGAQLDWRNYLLPIDAVVEKQEHIKQRCVDLGLLLGELVAGQAKSFVILLDACRDDPFGLGYQPDRKGLSQFDAPVGSLLAYATAPGRAAADGEGAHGLYTEHLLREFAVHNVRIEDALKRVRLNVRLQSQGEQIPWETTSLESDIMLFGTRPQKLADTEMEQLLEREIEYWNRIKNSVVIDEWVTYLRDYPNGRFAEIAQARLNRLLVANRMSKTAAVPKSPSQEPTHPAIELAPGHPASQVLASSANPYSSGYFPLGRRYSVGDEATIRESDLLTGVEVRIFTQRVTRVDVVADRVEINDGAGIWDLMGNPIKVGDREYDVPLQLYPAELQVGKTWTAAFKLTARGRSSNAYYDLRIAAREKVRVPAGEFDAFRIDGLGWNNTVGYQLEIHLWVMPGLIVPVRRDWIVRGRHQGRYKETQRHELVSLHQQATALD